MIDGRDRPALGLTVDQVEAAADLLAAGEILELLARDLPGAVAECLAEEDMAAPIAELHAQVVEYRGWVRQGVAMGAACPCLSGARR